MAPPRSAASSAMLAAAALELQNSPDLQLNLLLLLQDQRAQMQRLGETCVRDLLKSLQDYERRFEDLVSEQLQCFEATVLSAAQTAVGSKPMEADDCGDAAAKPETPKKVVDSTRSSCSDFLELGLRHLPGIDRVGQGIESLPTTLSRMSSIGSLELSSDFGRSPASRSGLGPRCKLERADGGSDSGLSEDTHGTCHGSPVWSGAHIAGERAVYAVLDDRDGDLLCSDPIEGEGGAAVPRFSDSEVPRVVLPPSRVARGGAGAELACHKESDYWC